MTSRAALTVDVELFRHTPAYRRAGGDLSDASLGIEGLEFLLERFESEDVSATFFVVSELSETHTDAIVAIDEAGHEIGSHTHEHRLLSELSARERRRELRHSRAVLESAVDGTVEGCRAPAFDVPEGYFGELREAGYRYDSSVLPARSIAGWYGGPYDVRVSGDVRSFCPSAPEGLTEVPISVMPGVRFPISGAWLRLFGLRYALFGMWLLARRGAVPVLYVHPWELVDLPPVEGVPKRVYWRTGAWMRRAIDRIIQAPFEFVPASALTTQSVTTSL